MTKIRFLDVHFTYNNLRSEMDVAYQRVMDSGQYIGGPELEDFERRFANFCGTAHALGVANGLDALILPLMASGIGRGDEVIVPAHTFIATWLAVSRTGATPVPVDADPLSMNMDLSQLEGAITSRTRAIVPVHLYGLPTRMERIMDLAAKHNLFVLEDAAQAHGAQIDGCAAGSLGHAAAFSFYPGKNLGAFGDGGMVVTDNSALIETVRLLGNYGAGKKYQHDSLGMNSRLDPLQAAFLNIKLNHIAAWNKHRQQIAALYQDHLGGLPETTLPQVPADMSSAWHLYVIRHPRRDALAKRLAAEGVQTAFHYPVPNHRSGAYRAQFGTLDLPVASAICATCLSLPIGPHLSLGQAERAAATIARCIRTGDNSAV